MVGEFGAELGQDVLTALDRRILGDQGVALETSQGSAERLVVHVPPTGTGEAVLQIGIATRSPHGEVDEHRTGPARFEDLPQKGMNLAHNVRFLPVSLRRRSIYGPQP